jgi:hypothetical protein
VDIRQTLVERLETSRAKMLEHLDEIDKNRKVYPLWTIREILAHLAGWDDALIALIKALAEGREPPTPAARGADVYNAETVSTREGLSYDHIQREYLETRRVLLEAIRALPAEKVTQPATLPWGGDGTLEDLVYLLGPHEEEHAEDVRKIIEESR